jgi:tRNA(His) 5'-end guanylyltransferase
MPEVNPKRSSLGDRMKSQYEDRYRIKLPRRTYTLVRVDGKAFHTCKRRLDKPFDKGFCDAMESTAACLLAEAQGGRLCYAQSDEIALLPTDIAELDTEAWFDGNLQKIGSVSAGTATAKFNACLVRPGVLATFDAWVFTIPDPREVANNFVWRTRGCVRNSVRAAGYLHFSPSQLHGRSTDHVRAMLREVGHP